MLNTIKRKINFIKLSLSSDTKHLKKDIDLKKEWLGNDYGGFFVAPEFLNQNSIIYSFGIGEDISFDLGVINKFKSFVFGFDPTPKSIKWMDSQNIPSEFSFFDYGIGSKTMKDTFYLPKNPDYVSGSTIQQSNVNLNSKIEVQLKNLSDISAELGHKKVDVIKIDIEGSEYDVIENILNSDIEIGQILVEIHERFFDDGKQKTIDMLENLRKHGFVVFGISETFEEISLINKNLIKQ